MSIGCLVWVFHNSKASGNDRLVLLCIADEANDYGASAFPSMERIAKKANVDKSTAIRCVKRLEQMGELRVHRHPKERQARGRHNTYEVVMVADHDHSDRWQSDTDPGSNGGTEADYRWHDEGLMVAPVPPNPSSDPSSDPRPKIEIWKQSDEVRSGIRDMQSAFKSGRPLRERKDTA